MRYGVLFGLAAGSLAAVLASTSATAQSASGTTVAAADNSAELGEVVVTARRRVESAEDVPVTVDVINAATLEERGIHTESDLQLSVPGLIVRSSNNSNELNYVMRGESVDAYSGSPPGVQPYIDEVPFPVMSSSPFYDLESVQAVKGPQGTLFGRNSTGGAVLFQTAMPHNEFGGYASVQYGNYDRLITEAAIDTPIIPDKLLVRFSGTVTSGGAYVRNLYDGSLLGDKQERSGRVTVDWKILDNLDSVTTVQIGHTGGTNTPNTAYYTLPCPNPTSGLPACLYTPANQPFFSNLLNGTQFKNYPSGFVYPGGFGTLPEYQRSVGKYVIDQNTLFTHLADSDLAINKTTYNITDDMSVKNIFGYSYSANSINYDDDYSPYPYIQQYAPTDLLNGGGLAMESSKTKTYSDELQLAGKTLDGRLNYLVGGFYLDANENYLSPLWLGAADASVAYNAITDNRSYAGFTQLTYKVTDALNVTAGGRYTKEKISMVQGADSIFLTAPGGSGQRTEESEPSWTLSVDYHLTHELMAYLSTRGSWRRGGFNPFNPPTAVPTTAAEPGGGNYFLPEKVRDVEGGFKFEGHIADMPLRANVAVYNSWVTDIQKTAYFVIAGVASSATINVPRADIWGIETDVNVRPIDWLRLGTAITYTDARFTDPNSILFGNTVVYGPFGDVPRFSGSVYGETSWKLPEDKGSLNFHVDVYGQSAFYFSNLGGTIQPGTQLPQYTLVNARLDWADIFGKQGVKVGFFIKNLTDRLYYTGGSAGAQNYTVESATYGMPRTYGVIVRADF
jgi:iron complex outermembrane recepter protein